jgi:hypothetical protein
LAEVVPNLQLCVPSRALLAGTGALSIWSYVGQVAVYGAVYAGLLLTFAALIFRRRDFI